MEAVFDLPKAKREKSVQNKTDVVHQIVLHNVSWETYEKILAGHNEVSNPHFAYCDGALEIMTLGWQHETLKNDLSELVTEIARILEIDYQGAASTTFRKEKKRKGFEGDATFYFKNADSMRGKKEIDLTVDPSPELVIEIDITHGSLAKFPIFAGIGIEEVWRFDGDEVSFYRLENETYRQTAESICLPKVKSETVTELLFAAGEMKRGEWLRVVHRSIEKKSDV